MTSAHRQEDIRIFIKECSSLAAAGYEVYQVSRGTSYEKNGVHLVGVGEISGNRLVRMLKGAKSVYRTARKLDADVYHLHDPELLPYGLKLKRAGKKVIFDSHEDVPAQIMDKAWIPAPFRRMVSALYKRYETYVVKRLDAVIVVGPTLVEKFQGRAKRVELISNYPRLDDIQFQTKPFSEREPIVCYAGGVNKLRGEDIMIEAMRDIDGVLLIAGDHQKMEIRGGVRYLGQIDRAGISALYGSAIAGLCFLLPIGNYYFSQPTKLYEYMAAGLPFVCADYPAWKAIAEESGAGICVDINNIAETRQAIRFLLENREKAQEMGRQGRMYVEKSHNWNTNAVKLTQLYSSITGGTENGPIHRHTEP